MLGAVPDRGSGVPLDHNSQLPPEGLPCEGVTGFRSARFASTGGLLPDSLQGVPEPNAAPEWQAERMWWFSRELMAACTLKGPVRRLHRAHGGLFPPANGLGGGGRIAFWPTN